MDHECFNLQNNEFEEELKAQKIKNQEFLDTFKEFYDSVLKKQREERERIAKEKEAEELEAGRKKKECLKIENSLPKASTRSRRSRIDPSLKGFKVFWFVTIFLRRQCKFILEVRDISGVMWHSRVGDGELQQPPRHHKGEREESEERKESARVGKETRSKRAQEEACER
ncbi:hypothetical protein Tco_1404841 [Tanacetum coccineum]